ncbi:hypothetical protein FA15DRAFT_672636 [Coprinopsis marcescibilis]|uniref:Uncharacterized protein n=1 Tax=Coprinopsis marcescibilis TaxID=230819 RepID=A0A5C3KM14_COPMA|nr:hypothetical protein FA15DRAFT_672636 [Coprinopsis marcescibilis]
MHFFLFIGFCLLWALQAVSRPIDLQRRADLVDDAVMLKRELYDLYLEAVIERRSNIQLEDISIRDPQQVNWLGPDGRHQIDGPRIHGRPGKLAQVWGKVKTKIMQPWENRRKRKQSLDTAAKWSSFHGKNGKK